MLKGIPQDLVMNWQHSVSIIPEGIYKILRICVYFVCVTLKGHMTLLCFHENIKTSNLIPLSVTSDSSFNCTVALQRQEDCPVHDPDMTDLPNYCLFVFNNALSCQTQSASE